MSPLFTQCLGSDKRSGAEAEELFDQTRDSLTRSLLCYCLSIPYLEPQAMAALHRHFLLVRLGLFWIEARGVLRFGEDEAPT